MEAESPIKKNFAAVLFMVGLLVISGVTASVVGYKVKTADIDRKAQLLAAYEATGGSFADLMTLSTTRVAANDHSNKNLFVATYELNERARKMGLYPTLESTPSYAVELALEGLKKIESTECFQAAQEAWHLFNQERAHTPTGGIVPTAARIAKRYDRAHARDVEVKLFKFLSENRVDIQPPLASEKSP